MSQLERGADFLKFQNFLTLRKVGQANVQTLIQISTIKETHLITTLAKKACQHNTAIKQQTIR